MIFPFKDFGIQILYFLSYRGWRLLFSTTATVVALLLNQNEVYYLDLCNSSYNFFSSFSLFLHSSFEMNGCYSTIIPTTPETVHVCKICNVPIFTLMPDIFRPFCEQKISFHILFSSIVVEDISKKTRKI